MKHFVVFILVAAFAVAGYGAKKKTMQPASKVPQVTLTGYLVDVHCAKKMMKKSDVAVQAKEHERKCDLMPDCAASGYGVFVIVPKTTTHASDVDFYKFDAAGNTMAKALLEKSTNKDNMLVTVNGKGAISVESIEPVK